MDYNPVQNIIRRVAPHYDNKEELLNLASEEEYQVWYKEDAECHATWIQQATNVGTKKYPPGAVIPSNALKHTTYKYCDHKGKKKEAKPQVNQEATQEDGPAKKKRRRAESIKVGCPAQLKVSVYYGGQVKVAYVWEHVNHDPTLIKDLSSSRLSQDKQWINEHVEKNMDWKSIKSLLRMGSDALEGLEGQAEIQGISSALLIKYADVRNAMMAKMNSVTRKHHHDRESVSRWLDEFKTKDYNILLDIPEYSNGTLSIAWISPWLKKYLEQAEDWFLDSTHKTCKFFIHGNDCYLATIVVYNPVSNKSVPAAFFITSKECTPVLTEWLEWVKDNNNTVVKRIMIDCSATEQSAIRDVYGPSVQTLLCHWHIKRAWESHIKKIKVPRASKEEETLRDVIRAEVNGLMHSQTVEVFEDRWIRFQEKHKVENKIFVDYMEKIWLPTKTKWVKAYRTEAFAHTNNLIESYHNLIKSYYLGRSRNLRIDRLVYILSQVVEIDYRQDSLQYYFGIKQVRLNKEDTARQARADAIPFEQGRLMIQEIEPDRIESFKLYSCQSFDPEKEDVRYDEVKFSGSVLSRCSWADAVRFCKHIFLVSRVLDLPITIQKSVRLSSPLLLQLQEIGSDSLPLESMAMLESEQQQQQEEAEVEANLLLIKESNEKAWKRLQTSVASAFTSANTLQQQEELLDNFEANEFFDRSKKWFEKAAVNQIFE